MIEIKIRYNESKIKEGIREALQTCNGNSLINEWYYDAELDSQPALANT